MLNKLLKVLFLSIQFSIMMIGIIFAENITMNFSYGINNVAKNANQLPIEIKVQNKDEEKFNGQVLINVYESNKSVYIYESNIEVEAKKDSYVNRNIAITSRANTIVVEIYNKKGEMLLTERTNIDLSYLDDSLIIGAITEDIRKINYIDGISFYNNSLRTKLVQISKEAYNHNKNIFDQVDAVLISDIDARNFDDGVLFALQKFVDSGKPVIVGLGGKYGAYNMPQIFNKYFFGPTIETNSYGKSITKFNLIEGKKLIDIEDGIDVMYTKTDNTLLICSMLNFADFNTFNDAQKIISDILEKGFGKNRLDRVLNLSHEYLTSDYYNVNNLLSMVDRQKLPDIFILSIVLVFYVLLVTIIIYVFLRNIGKRKLYGKCVIVSSIVFTIFMVYMGFSVMKKNTFLTYISIVDIKNENTNEHSFFNFRTSERGSYKFDTSANNKIYPMVKTSNEAIVSANFMDMNKVKKTTFSQENNRINISVDNAEDFDSNIFVYDNNNYLNDIYNIDCSIDRFDGDITGRITNNMDVKITNASVLMYGKILKIGDIEPNHSVSLSRAEKLNVPIGNNFMISEILGSGNNQSVIKYYLDENLYEYYDYAMLFGFIDENGTIDINSTDVGDVYGKTLIIRRIENDRRENMYDLCSLSDEVENVSGYYDYANNAINGDVEVVNEYQFEKNYLISKIYLEGLSNYDLGKIDFNVPFYGDIYVFNRITNNFDKVNDSKIEFQNLSNYLTDDNKIIFKFLSSSRDPLYRKISLPLIRAIGSR